MINVGFADMPLRIKIAKIYRRYNEKFLSVNIKKVLLARALLAYNYKTPTDSL